eukprot:TRINITY_DN9972_c0_g1_i1.p1 TRINITY_DN9972_c0_g1~~TRINITY_DN9972_c0_g1_i1.p1  ORF type:complete len:271 (-),score=48.92 TRINITY_DN9972_c0_g1_i1:201-1013(-)
METLGQSETSDSKRIKTATEADAENRASQSAPTPQPFSDPFTIEPLTVPDAARAAAITTEAFQREPMTVVMSISAEDFGLWCDGFTLRAADTGVSTVAKDADGKVVAACLCVDGADKYTEDSEDPELVFQSIDEILHTVQGRYLISRGFTPVYDITHPVHSLADTEPRELQPLQRGRLIHVLTIACDQSVQGKGLVTRLCKASLDLAREKGFKEAFLEATNPRSQSTSVRLGFNPEQILTYPLFVTSFGTRPFKSMPKSVPHLILYALKL